MGMGKETSVGKLGGGRRRLRSSTQRDSPDQLQRLGFSSGLQPRQAALQSGC